MIIGAIIVTSKKGKGRVMPYSVSSPPSPLLVFTFNSPENPRILAQDGLRVMLNLFASLLLLLHSSRRKSSPLPFPWALFFVTQNKSPRRVRPDLKRKGKRKTTSRPVIIGSSALLARDAPARASVPIPSCVFCIQNKIFEQHSKKKVCSPTHDIAPS